LPPLAPSTSSFLPIVLPVVLLGALGGLATAGILGMFVGATLMAVGHQMFMIWLATTPHSAA